MMAHNLRWGRVLHSQFCGYVIVQSSKMTGNRFSTCSTASLDTKYPFTHQASINGYAIRRALSVLLVSLGGRFTRRIFRRAIELRTISSFVHDTSLRYEGSSCPAVLRCYSCDIRPLSYLHGGLVMLQLSILALKIAWGKEMKRRTLIIGFRRLYRYLITGLQREHVSNLSLLYMSSISAI